MPAFGLGTSLHWLSQRFCLKQTKVTLQQKQRQQSKSACARVRVRDSASSGGCYRACDSLPDSRSPSRTFVWHHFEPRPQKQRLSGGAPIFCGMQEI
jgi:hypothetical protein